jgi:4-oxalomesaconate tautomerase
MSVEHPSGELSINLDIDRSGTIPDVKQAGLLRTARLLSRGELYLPVYQ